MWKCIAGWISHQVWDQRNSFVAATGLPFAKLLHKDRVQSRRAGTR